MQRSRARIANQVRSMLDAALRLIREKGDSFTTQELVKEAGVALQTFYRYFPSKDELLLAVIADAMNDACEQWEAAARELPDPVARLRFYITTIIDVLDSEGGDGGTAKFIVSTHWRLHRIFPEELAEAEKPFADLLLTEINAGVEAGLLAPANPEWAAWFVAELVRSVYHYYAYAAREADVKEHLWQFCLTALGGAPG
ncbi:TetR family transcriptional regulator [Mycobacterium paraense]|uniref:TetR family transcriptional regulator n=1 Tax=Mycobacterium paraense TaxID=767916 RepID=A0ABX3VRV9_9MYCO|nr:TetR/AcrR family transcriptional regulator [Mycobacterium paraense]ORW32662.1 TetR family transcriptional regulator [Mycobacterium paraense]ORW37993.1 TetR family transcriptional regulator [Mycobacterium paraense]